MFAFLAVFLLSQGSLPAPPNQEGISSSIAFIRNDGQWDSQAKFMAQSPGLNMWVTDNGLTLDFHAFTQHGRRGHVVKVRFSADMSGTAVGSIPSPGRVNFLVGSQKRWTTDVPAFSEAWVKGVANGIDARYYNDKGVPRYDLVLRPGAKPSDLKMTFEGASNPRVGRDGLLRYDTALGTVVERGLFAYQKVDSGIKQVGAVPVVESKGTVSFKLGAYDSKKPVIIDPTISAPITVGSLGAGSVGGMATDADGSTILVGSTTSSTFPTTTGAYDTSWDGPEAGFISRLSATGTTIWTTYFGSNIDIKAVAIDDAHQPVVCGIAEFGAFTGTPGSFQPDIAGEDDGFVAKLSSSGDSLLWATYAGSTLNDGFTCLTLDATANVYVGGWTLGNFPVGNGGFDRTFANDAYPDGVVMKLSADGHTRLAGTFIGDRKEDFAYAIKLDSANNVIVGGTCGASTFPRSASGVLDSVYSGTLEGFVAKFTNSLSSLTWCTFVGGDRKDEILCLAIAPDDSIVAGGYTTSIGSFVGVSGTVDTNDDGFILRITSSGKAANTPYTGRYIGANRYEHINDLRLEPSGSVVAVGYSNAIGNLANITTSGAPFPGRTGSEVTTSYDSFLVRLDPSLLNITFGTFLGLTGNDKAWGLSLIDGSALITSVRTVSSVNNALITRINFDQLLNGLSVNPSSIVGSPGSVGQVTGTVSLSQAQSTDTVVTLTSSNAAATVPASVTVPVGATTADFTINTTEVTAATNVTLTATAASSSVSTILAVTPIAVSATVSLDAASLIGNPGRTLGGTVTLSQAVGNNVTVSLSSSNTSQATVPTSVTVLAGNTSASFSVTSQQALLTPVNSIRIRGTYNGVNSDAFFDMLPPDVNTITFSPAALNAGQTADVTVTFNTPIPADGQTFPKNLVYASGVNSGQTVPSDTVLSFQNDNPVPAGATEFTFQALAKNLSLNTDVQLKAGGKTSNILTVTASAAEGPIQSVTFNPLSASGPKTFFGTVTLKDPAPASGVQVTISTTSPIATLSTTTVTVTSSRYGAFSVSVPIVESDTVVSVDAKFNPSDAPVTGSFTILAPIIKQVDIANLGAAPGGSTTMKIVLTGPAPPAGVTVTVADDGTGRLTFTKGTTMKIGSGYSSFTQTVIVSAAAVSGTTIPCTATISGKPPFNFVVKVL